MHSPHYSRRGDTHSFGWWASNRDVADTARPGQAVDSTTLPARRLQSDCQIFEHDLARLGQRAKSFYAAYGREAFCYYCLRVREQLDRILADGDEVHPDLQLTLFPKND